MSAQQGPTYNLALLQKKVRRKFERVISGTAATDARALGFTEEHIVECVCSIDQAMFYKTMLAERIPGLWQDVYHVPFKGEMLYVKLQSNAQEQAVIVSFKRK